MGPEATAQLYLEVIRLCQKEFGAKSDSDFPEIIIFSLPIPDVVDKPNKNRLVAEMLTNKAKQLEQLGVNFIAIPCNTVNYFFSEIKMAVSVPVINILEETAKEVKRLKLKTVGLLGTKMTIDKGIYRQFLNGVKIVKPNRQQQKEITKIILSVMAGNKKQKDQNSLKKIIVELNSKGAEKVILGCTELPLLIEKDADTINTIKILTKKIVEQANAGEK